MAIFLTLPPFLVLPWCRFNIFSCILYFHNIEKNFLRFNGGWKSKYVKSNVATELFLIFISQHYKDSFKFKFNLLAYSLDYIKFV